MTMPQNPRGILRQFCCEARRSRMATTVEAVTQTASTMPNAACQ